MFELLALVFIAPALPLLFYFLPAPQKYSQPLLKITHLITRSDVSQKQEKNPIKCRLIIASVAVLRL